MSSRCFYIIYQNLPNALSNFLAMYNDLLVVVTHIAAYATQHVLHENITRDMTSYVNNCCGFYHLRVAFLIMEKWSKHYASHS